MLSGIPAKSSVSWKYPVDGNFRALIVSFWINRENSYYWNNLFKFWREEFIAGLKSETPVYIPLKSEDSLVKRSIKAF